MRGRQIVLNVTLKMPNRCIETKQVLVDGFEFLTDIQTVVQVALKTQYDITVCEIMVISFYTRNNVRLK